MSETYSKHANICTKFYSLTNNAADVAQFAFNHISAASGQSALFVGGMFDVAAKLRDLGLQITATDYTDEMVNLGKVALPESTVLRADLKSLSFTREFELVFVLGRVFTHMLSDEDLHKAISGCCNALVPGGKIFADNYESCKIQTTNYFNGQISCSDSTSSITRNSSTSLSSERPHIVCWTACYSGEIENKSFEFTDSMEHRAFTREDFASHLNQRGLTVLKQGDNFDETSFYTVAVKT